MKINKLSTQGGNFNNYEKVDTVNHFENGGLVIGSGAPRQAELQSALAAVLEEISAARDTGALTGVVAGKLEGQVREAAEAVTGPNADGQTAKGKLTTARQFLVGSGGAPAIVAALSAAINAANAF
ncbi:hypothetical protein PUR71_12990 [Streptomyces sp. SP17BM10]|uniref:hypothetical protein n=1 Tax=Streptomyces sp. SP17BM10 TaxID=3002530 RepID=UPI002E78CCF3|nr:hypothetical protein [Streptomyces sp. SP17BM10]MEE1783816.1 hypothetical protein [Streptomyces sp. SP17BM10]